jgi:hypothetical protein
MAGLAGHPTWPDLGAPEDYKSKKKGMLDEPTLKELQNEIRHMDEAKLLAFGRKHQSAHNFMNKTPTTALLVFNFKANRYPIGPSPLGVAKIVSGGR